MASLNPLQHGGNLNAALYANYCLADTNIYIPDSEDNLIDIDVQEETSLDVTTRELLHLPKTSNASTNLADHTTISFDLVEVTVEMSYEVFGRSGLRPNDTLLHNMDDFEEEIEEGQDALPEHRQSHLQDSFLAHVISLPLETAEKEKQLCENASRTGSGVSEELDVEQQQMKPSSSSVEARNTSYQNKPEDKESRVVPAASVIGASSPDEWPTLQEAAMIREIPETRYRSGSLAPGTPSPAAEAHRLIREKQDKEYYESLQADRDKEIREAEARQLEMQAARNAERRKMDEEQELEKHLAEKEASLPLESAIDEENAVTILVRMPNGNRLSRRFMKSHNLQTLFDFIDISRLVKPNTYRLVKPLPRQAFGAEQSCSTLQELGLINKQEALFLEMM